MAVRPSQEFLMGVAKRHCRTTYVRAAGRACKNNIAWTVVAVGQNVTELSSWNHSLGYWYLLCRCPSICLQLEVCFAFFETEIPFSLPLGHHPVIQIKTISKCQWSTYLSASGQEKGTPGDKSMSCFGTQKLLQCR